MTRFTCSTPRPLPRLRGALQRIQDPLDFDGVGEIGAESFAAGDTLEELREGRDERVLVADDVAGPPEVREDRVLHVGDEQVARTLLGRRLGGVHELEVIEPLQIEAQHPFRAVDLERIPVLDANPEARRLEQAEAAVLEFQHRRERVVDLPAWREGSGDPDSFADRTVQVQRRIEQMRQQSAEFSRKVELMALRERIEALERVRAGIQPIAAIGMMIVAACIAALVSYFARPS